MHTGFVVIGVMMSVSGISLASAPELVTRALRAANLRVQSILRRTPRDQVVHVPTATAIAFAGSAIGQVSIPADRPIEQQQEFLRDQAARVLARIGRLENKVANDLPGHWQADIRKAESAIRNDVALTFEDARNEYIRQRVIGAVILTNSNSRSRSRSHTAQPKPRRDAPSPGSRDSNAPSYPEGVGRPHQWRGRLDRRRASPLERVG
jgi:hypothetical protein